MTEDPRQPEQPIPYKILIKVLTPFEDKKTGKQVEHEIEANGGFTVGDRGELTLWAENGMLIRAFAPGFWAEAAIGDIIPLNMEDTENAEDAEETE